MYMYPLTFNRTRLFNLAEALGKKEDAKLFYKRSRSIYIKDLRLLIDLRS